MVIFMPRTSAWLVLLFVCAPLIGLGALGFAEDTSSWPVSAALVAGCLIASVTTGHFDWSLHRKRCDLSVSARTVWRAPVIGTKLFNGRGGDLANLSAYILCRDGQKVGYILKSSFDENVIAQLQKSLKS